MDFAKTLWRKQLGNPLKHQTLKLSQVVSVFRAFRTGKPGKVWGASDLLRVAYRGQHNACGQAGGGGEELGGFREAEGVQQFLTLGLGIT